MKILIVEDDFISRLLLQELLKSYGTTPTSLLTARKLWKPAALR